MTLQEIQSKAKAMTSAQRIKVGIKVISDETAPISQQERMRYLLECGLSQTEYLEALNQSSNGELLAAAGL